METDDRNFLTAFETAALPRIEWTHRAHLRMAYLYLCDTRDVETLRPIVRQRIRAYNAAHGRLTGYHETITTAFLRLVAARLCGKPISPFAEFERANSDLFAPGIGVLFRYYEKATLSSPEAHTEFVPPDHEPLP